MCIFCAQVKAFAEINLAIAKPYLIQELKRQGRQQTENYSLLNIILYFYFLLYRFCSSFQVILKKYSWQCHLFELRMFIPSANILGSFSPIFFFLRSSIKCFFFCILTLSSMSQHFSNILSPFRLYDKFENLAVSSQH